MRKQAKFIGESEDQGVSQEEDPVFHVQIQCFHVQRDEGKRRNIMDFDFIHTLRVL